MNSLAIILSSANAHISVVILVAVCVVGMLVALFHEFDDFPPA
jgi:hypothetical protein